MRIVLALVVLAIAIVASFGADTDLVNSKVERSIDLASQLARHSVSITVQNKGSKDVSQYLLTLQDRYQTPHLSFIKVEDADGTPLKVTPGEKDTKNKESYTVYKVDLAKSVGAGKSTTLRVTLVFTHTMKALPTHISQTDRQLVRYYDNHFFFSPYTTGSQKTVVKLASSSVEHYSENAPTQLSRDTLTYGPYEDIRPFTHSEMLIHFENNAPFATITKLVKEFEISHWGNLAVEQWMEVVHDGALLKGPFSRFDFQRNPGSSPSAILQLTEVLPLGASDVYYRDDIGNISTSSFTVSSKGLEFHIIPRFPLFGGWRNNFYMGYNLPLDMYLYNDANDRSLFVLNATFAVEMSDVVIDHLVVKVILPEGAKDAKVVVPFSVDTQAEEKHFTYLDTIGRTVLVIEKRNVVVDHNQYFQVEYHFSRFRLLQEPLLVSGAFFFFILTIMFFVRFELSIKKGGEETKPQVDIKLQSILDRFRGIVDSRNRHHAKLDDLVRSLSDPVLFKEQRERLVDVNLAPLRQEAANLIFQVERINPSIADRLRDLEALEEERLDAKLALQNLEISFKKGEVKKAKYEKEKEDLQKTLASTIDEIKTLSSDLFA